MTHTRTDVRRRVQNCEGLDNGLTVCYDGILPVGNYPSGIHTHGGTHMLYISPLTMDDFLTWDDDLASPVYDDLTEAELHEVILARGDAEQLPDDLTWDDEFTWSEDND